jgi:hypothetical protein
MSWSPCPDPALGDRAACDAVEMVIAPHAVGLGEMTVRRALPSVQRQMVGPFIFFDQMGPAEFMTDQGVDVRPHPHINLATQTHLLDGRIRQRDSIGAGQLIEPGAVNWMRAGRGVTHSERTDDERKATGQRLFGVESWMASPEAVEESDPAFMHHAATETPVIEAWRHGAADRRRRVRRILAARRSLAAIPQILAARPGMRVLIVSGLTSTGAATSLRALEQGASDCLAKPLARDSGGARVFRAELMARLRALGERRATRQVRAARCALLWTGRRGTPPRCGTAGDRRFHWRTAGAGAGAVPAGADAQDPGDGRPAHARVLHADPRAQSLAPDRP